MNSFRLETTDMPTRGTDNHTSKESQPHSTRYAFDILDLTTGSSETLLSRSDQHPDRFSLAG